MADDADLALGADVALVLDLELLDGRISMSQPVIGD